MTGKGWIDNNIFYEHLGLTRRWNVPLGVSWCEVGPRSTA